MITTKTNLSPSDPTTALYLSRAFSCKKEELPMRISSAAAWLPTPPPAMAIPKNRKEEQRREEKRKKEKKKKEQRKDRERKGEMKRGKTNEGEERTKEKRERGTGKRR